MNVHLYYYYISEKKICQLFFVLFIVCPKSVFEAVSMQRGHSLTAGRRTSFNNIFRKYNEKILDVQLNLFTIIYNNCIYNKRSVFTARRRLHEYPSKGGA